MPRPLQWGNEKKRSRRQLSHPMERVCQCTIAFTGPCAPPPQVLSWGTIQLQVCHSDPPLPLLLPWPGILRRRSDRPALHRSRFDPAAPRTPVRLSPHPQRTCCSAALSPCPSLPQTLMARTQLKHFFKSQTDWDSFWSCPGLPQHESHIHSYITPGQNTSHQGTGKNMPQVLHTTQSETLTHFTKLDTDTFD